MSDLVIETRGLTKEFGGFTAVQDVELQVRRGSIHALIGPNGAGKTTVFNLLTKFFAPSRGRILYDGRDVTGARPADLARQGMVRSFQISATFPHLTVRENVRIALQRELGTSFHFWRSETSLEVLNERADELLEAVGLAGQAETTAVELPYGRKRALEIATTLALEPKIMLLDEPTAGMGHEDVGRVAAADPQGGARPHRAHGRAQPLRGRRSVGHHYRHAARPRARRRQLRGGLGQSGGARSLHGDRPCLSGASARVRCCGSRA